jgi:hypothetical protein
MSIVYEKIRDLHDRFLSAYRESAGYPAPVTGFEREVFITAFLEKILPPSSRIGTGVIADATGAKTGQVDIVIELPLSLSFPISEWSRLYLANSVGAVIEVKSDLNSQWHEVVEKMDDVRSVERHPHKPGEIILYEHWLIPVLVVAYKGPKQLKTIERKVGSPRVRLPPAGIFVVEDGLFFGVLDGQRTSAKGPATATYAFISCLFDALQNRSDGKLDFGSFGPLLKAGGAAKTKK